MTELPTSCPNCGAAMTGPGKLEAVINQVATLARAHHDPLSSEGSEIDHYMISPGLFREVLEMTQLPETGASLMGDNINHPDHYTAGSIECIEAIQSALTPDEFRGFCKGCVIKYTWRERAKGGDESLQKAQWYLEKLRETSLDD